MLTHAVSVCLCVCVVDGCSNGQASADTIEIVFGSFPHVVAVTIVVVLLVVAWSFRSILIAVRSVVTIGLTILWYVVCT